MNRIPRAGPIAGAPSRPSQRVPLFAELDRKRARPRSPGLFKERRFCEGETVVMEGSGGAAFFLIDSGEAAVSIRGVDEETLARRLLR